MLKKQIANCTKIGLSLLSSAILLGASPLNLAFAETITKEATVSSAQYGNLHVIIEGEEKDIPKGSTFNAAFMEDDNFEEISEYDKLYNKLDNELKSSAEKIGIYKLELLKNAGNNTATSAETPDVIISDALNDENTSSVPIARSEQTEKITDFSSPVKVYLEVPDGFDAKEVEAYYISENKDEEFSEEVIEKNGKKYVKINTKHFSPYVLIDKETKGAFYSILGASIIGTVLIAAIIAFILHKKKSVAAE